jgi:hypothetical protein
MSVVGAVWLGLVMLSGLSVVRGGSLEGFFAAVGGGFVPALALIAMGRAIRRRAALAEASGSTPVPQRPKPIPAPPPQAPRPQQPSPVAPRTSSEPAANTSAAPPPSPRVVSPREAEARAMDTADDFDPAGEDMFDIDFGIEGGMPPKSSKEMIEEAKRRLSEFDG